MPTYEYRCDTCAGEFEYFQQMSDEPLQKCERCGGHLTKLLSAGSGLIFKGTGFYITDYKKSSTASSASESPKGGGVTDTKTSTAPAKVEKVPAKTE